MNKTLNTQSAGINLPHLLGGVAMALILVTGLIHWVEAPDNLTEAPYKGVLFVMNGVAAIVAAIGIYRNERTWGWLLGLFIAGSALAAYVMSRTIGLPGLEVDAAWFEPIGILSVLIEVAFVGVAAWALQSHERELPQISKSN